MVEITLFELHLPEAQFNAPFSGSGGGRGADTDARESTEDDPVTEDDGGSAAGAVVAIAGAVLAVVLLAWLASRSRRPAPDDGP